MNSRFRDTSEQDRPLERPTRRRPLLLAGGAVAVGLLVLLGGGRLRQMLSADSAVSAARLSIATVDVAPLTRDVAGEGRVVAAQSPTLFAPGAGTVTLAVKAGDPVKRGQVLARVDSPELTNRLAQERSNVDALRADLARAEVEARQQTAALQSAYENARIDQQTAANDLARQTQAFEAGATARMQVERAQDALAKARLALDQARDLRGLKTDSLKLDVQAKQSALSRQQLLVADLERQVAELQVRSPVDGQVGQVHVEQRANVAANAPLLQVVDLTAFEVEIDVPESFARDLGIGMPADIRVAGTDVPGTVRSVSPQVVNGRVVGRLRFDGEPPAGLRQNQRVTARIVLDEKADALLVERGPFLEAGQGRFAYRVRDGIAERVPLATGVASLDAVEIIDGAEVGDRIVVSGVEALGDAGRVRLSGL